MTLGDAVRKLQAREGPEAELWEFLFRELSPKLARMARALMTDPEDAKDLLQTTFLQLHANRDRIEHPDRVVAFARRTLRNLAYSEYRRRMRRQQFFVAQMADVRRGLPPASVGEPRGEYLSGQEFEHRKGIQASLDSDPSSAPAGNYSSKLSLDRLAIIHSLLTDHDVFSMVERKILYFRVFRSPNRAKCAAELGIPLEMVETLSDTALKKLKLAVKKRVGS